eukprot:GHVS01091040.1.p1 GENE.GHVS01091040.1~~GHVS01091040.1.p1  ORF type:complete len:430 (-),score=99.86 GHVS01091040.1:1046-2335(-)
MKASSTPDLTPTSPATNITPTSRATNICGGAITPPLLDLLHLTPINTPTDDTADLPPLVLQQYSPEPLSCPRPPHYFSIATPCAQRTNSSPSFKWWLGKQKVLQQIWNKRKEEEGHPPLANADLFRCRVVLDSQIHDSTLEGRSSRAWWGGKKASKYGGCTLTSTTSANTGSRFGNSGNAGNSGNTHNGDDTGNGDDSGNGDGSGNGGSGNGGKTGNGGYGGNGDNTGNSGNGDNTGNSGNGDNTGNSGDTGNGGTGRDSDSSLHDLLHQYNALLGDLTEQNTKLQQQVKELKQEQEQTPHTGHSPSVDASTSMLSSLLSHLLPISSPSPSAMDRLLVSSADLAAASVTFPSVADLLAVVCQLLSRRADCDRCKKQIVQTQNHRTACSYHPGSLRFYSCSNCGGTKYFTCCRKCDICSPGCKQDYHVFH